MCGIIGIIDLHKKERIHLDEMKKMLFVLEHRGPDAKNIFFDKNIIFGFNRLSIIDIEHGMQPNTNNAGDIISICNGEIYNHHALRKELILGGSKFVSSVDTEVIPHLFEKQGVNFVNDLNGQFAIALFNKKTSKCYLYRDHFGISPLYYTVANGLLIFASEIKAILKYPLISPELDLTGLDQILNFPGMISPRTMFKNINSLRPGECLTIDMTNASIANHIYWDFDYSENCDNNLISESDYIDGLLYYLKKSVNFRLQADVPVSFYLSGGIDSSLILALAKAEYPDLLLNTYSVIFPDDKLIDERKYQQLMVDSVGADHHFFEFDYHCIIENLKKVIYHTECPIKESFDTAALSLSNYVKKNNCKVIIAGQGADELFGGYPGYKFDQIRSEFASEISKDEKLIRRKIWGDEKYFYEKNFSEYIAKKNLLYSDKVKNNFDEIDSLNYFIIDKPKLTKMDLLQKRSYLDFKLRLADHLLSDHGDKMLMANSVEGRYPFLDQDLVNFSIKIPSRLKVKDLTEKYIIKKISGSYIPREITNREKFGFTAPGSPYILRKQDHIINDLLSYDTIKRQGIFDPDQIEELKTKYSHQNFRINVPFDDDFMMIVLTTGIFLQVFNMSGI